MLNRTVPALPNVSRTSNPVLSMAVSRSSSVSMAGELMFPAIVVSFVDAMVSNQPMSIALHMGVVHAATANCVYQVLHRLQDRNI